MLVTQDIACTLGTELQCIGAQPPLRRGFKCPGTQTIIIHFREGRVEFQHRDAGNGNFQVEHTSPQ